MNWIEIKKRDFIKKGENRKEEERESKDRYIEIAKILRSA
jgi:hypothetical protein